MKCLRRGEEEEKNTRIKKWISESQNPNSQSQTIATSSNQTQSQPQQNFQPQKVEPLPEHSVTASIVMERPQANSQATTSTPTQLSSQTQGQQLSPPSQQNKNNCCIVS